MVKNKNNYSEKAHMFEYGATTGHWTDAGVRYINKNFLQNGMKRRSKIRTKEEFILELQTLSETDKRFLNYTYVRKQKRSDLLWEAVVHFGGWRGAIEALGLRPIQKGWTKEKIIEIKMNCSDSSVKKDIEKYLPFCQKLEIWYLFGKPFGILSNKVNFIGPNRIKERIKTNPILLEKFYAIKKEVNNVRYKPKKVLVLGSGAHRISTDT